MKFLHTTLSNSKKILRCLVIPLTTPDVTNTLIFFQDHFQYLQIDNSTSSVSISILETYPLDSQILQCFMIKNQIGVVTKDGYLLILDSSPPFSRITSYQLCELVIPSSAPFAHYSQNISNDLILLSGFKQNGVLVSFSEDNEIDLHKIDFSSDFIIISQTFTESPNIFAFLICDSQKNKQIMFYNITDMIEIKRISLPNDSFAITTTTNIETNEYKIIIFTFSEILIFQKDDKEFFFNFSEMIIENKFNILHSPVYDRIITWVNMQNGQILLQFDNGEIFGFDPNNQQLYKKGYLPIISYFHILPNNNLLFCVSEYDDSFFIQFSPNYPVSETSIDFQLLPQTNLFLKQRITSAIFHNKNLVLSSGSDKQTYLIHYSNSLPFTSHLIEDVTQAFNEHITYIENQNTNNPLVNNTIKIFSCNNEVFIASTKRYSTIFYGKLNSSSISSISSSSTLEVATFSFPYNSTHHKNAFEHNNSFVHENLSKNDKLFEQSGLVQIHRKGIKSLDLNWEFEWNSYKRDVVACAVGTNEICVALDDSKIILFNSNLEICYEKEILGNVSAIVFCGTFIAIACEFEDKSFITIYSNDLSKHAYPQINFTSKIVSLVFIEETMSLYASTLDGHVLSWSFKYCDFIDSCSLFFASSKTSTLFAMGSDLLIVNEKVYLYDGEKISPIQIDPPLSISIVDSDTFVALLYNLAIVEVQIDKNASNLIIDSEIGLHATIRKLSVLKQSSNVLALNRNSNDSFLSLIDKDTTSKSLEIENKSLLAISQLILHQDIDDKTPKAVNLDGKFSDKKSMKETILIGFSMKNENSTGLIYLYELVNKKLVNEQIADNELNQEKSETDFIKLNIEINTPGIPFSMQKFKNDVIVGINKSLYLLSVTDWSLSNKPLASVPTQTAFIECSDHFVWVGDRTQGVFCFQPSKNENDQLFFKLVAIDTEQRQITALCILNDFTVAIGDKFGVITVVKLTNDIIYGTPWGAFNPPDRGISIPPGKYFEKVASFSIGNQAVTSLLKNPFNSSFFYTTLFGQIGAFVPIKNDGEFSVLNEASVAAEKVCSNAFGALQFRKFSDAKISVFSTKYIDYAKSFGSEGIIELEEATKIPFAQLMGLICRYKSLATF
ncbi:hypothetical protein TRFO_26927 [Tritrichomonas foetus]|uniref:DNA damage-binding protein 1 n=1 Tax=Tritrichomonas foetus TaxID=1144522 RepID=A0A1J4K6H6_9EUKA|nr:hypothetical protein TRFO_26927 [Tritrichomonas foetus]|eukprot:OHT05310.1 hypothetical protein TRFO_26927 [Tritrichomonas foetus]